MHCNNYNRKGHIAKYCRNLAPVVKTRNNAGGNYGCYEYGEVCHFKKECPKLKDQGGNGRGRAFVIGARGEINDPNVVTDTFPVNNVYTLVLFDSGTDRSFITPKFTQLLSHKSSRLNETYVIEIDNG